MHHIMGGQAKPEASYTAFVAQTRFCCGVLYVMEDTNCPLRVRFLMLIR
jgi:hypothetical protein